MFNAPKRVLIPIKPEGDESLTGYLMRLGEANFYPSPAWLMQAAGLADQDSTGEYAMAEFCPTDLTQLAELTGVDGSVLEQMQHSPAHSLLPKGRLLMFRFDLPKHLVRNRIAKVCTACLREAGYVRRLWALAPLTACPIHRLLLLDRCPKCSKRLTAARKRVSFCGCGLDWRTLAGELVGDSELCVSRHIHRLCRVLAGEAADALKSSPLLSLDLEHFLLALLFVAHHQKGDPCLNRRRMALTLSNAKLHSMLNGAFAVFLDWPTRFHDFLRWYEGQNRRTRLSERVQSGLQRDFGSLYLQLYKMRRAEQFAFMREEFELYVKTRWSGGMLRNSSLVSPGAVVRSEKYLSQIEATRRIGIGIDLVRRLIKIGKLKTLRTPGKVRNVLIEVDSCDAVRLSLEGSLTLRQTAALLGVSQVATVDLVKKGCLVAFMGTALQEYRFKRWIFERRAVDHLLERVGRCVLPLHSPRKTQLMSFQRALSSHSYISFSTGDFVNAILGGEITPVVKASGRGLSCLRFAKSQVAEFFQKHFRDRKSGLLTMADTAIELGMDAYLVSFLINKGLLRAADSRRARSKGLITAQEIERFSLTYTTLGTKLTRALNTTPVKIADLLLARGVWPVTGPNVDGGRSYVYKKADLASINLPELVAKVKDGPKAGQRLCHLIGPLVASVMLSISEEELDNLVSGGKLRALTPPSPGGKAGAKKVFSRREVAEYKRRLLDGRDLVTVSEAAEILNRHPATLYERWVRPGRLKVIDLGRGCHRYYFLRKDVEALRPPARESLTRREVAAILNVNFDTLGRLHETGALNPVAVKKINDSLSTLYSRTEVEEFKRQRRQQQLSRS
jgi:predicted site-specific integrase-resolvase